MFCDGHLFSDPNLTVFNVHIPGRWEPTMHLVYKWGILLKTSPGGTSVKNLPANAEDMKETEIRSWGQENPLE